MCFGIRVLTYFAGISNLLFSYPVKGGCELFRDQQTTHEDCNLNPYPANVENMVSS